MGGGHGSDIVVSQAESKFSVTYRKDGEAPMFVAIDGIGRSSEPSQLLFWARAWKAAHEKACTIGWLRSYRPGAEFSLR